MAVANDCGGCFCVPDDSGKGDCPSFVPETEFSPEIILAFQSKVLLNPFDNLSCNPYEDKGCATSPPQEELLNGEAVCAFKYVADDCNSYTMHTYRSASEAEADGAVVTHEKSCGLCSTAQDLSVYMANPDMTHEGKVCASKGLISSKWGKKCYMELGYTEACAEIWNYDGIFDGQQCKWTCLGSIFKGEPNNGPPPACEINSCLQCDEDEAGPLFKQFAGRTRRRSGLLSAIVRGCDDFAFLHPTDTLCPSVAEL